MNLLMAAVGSLGCGALATVLLRRRERLAGIAMAAALVVAALGGGAAAVRVLAGLPTPDYVRPWSLPGAVFHLGMDALSAVFLLLVLFVGGCAGIYGEGYIAASRGHVRAMPARFFFLVFIASMSLLVAARNAFLFMVAWETMALSAFGLVVSEHERAEVRKAGRIYLLCAHIGSLCLLALFAILGRNAGSLEFAAFASAPPLPPGPATAALALALVGFGMKAGFLPLHVWLQEAHPAAPSHASAAMSGVMIEMGLYGLLRLLALAGPVSKEAATFVVALGLATAVFGIMFAMVQRDLKRLLAYSSVENVGIALVGLGLGCYGLAAGSAPLALLGFTAAVLHTLNHGFFKSLLFLSAGALSQAAGTRDLEACGGLQRRMPWTCALAAIGAAAICGLPPLNGFTGEWLLYSWLIRPDLGHDLRLTSLAAALLALVGAMAVVALSKFYGLACLGQPRSEGARRAAEPARIMLAPMAALAIPCVVIGVFPAPALRAASAAAACVSHASVAAVSAADEQWARLLGAVGMLGIGVWVLAALLWALRSALVAERTGAGPTWGCGFTAPSPRMQYTASSFPVPMARVLTAMLGTREEAQPPSGYWPAAASYKSATPDPALEIWLPAATTRVMDGLAWPRRFQRGRLQSYLLYVLVFLVALLLWKL